MSQRRRHHKAEDLSPEAQQIIEQGLLGQATYEQIADKVLASTKETISPAAVGRYHQAKVRPRMQAMQLTQRMAADLEEAMQGATESEMRRALAAKAAVTLYPMMEQLAAGDPATAAQFYSQLEQRRIAERQLEQRAKESELRAQAIENQRKLAEARLQQIARKVEKLEAKPKRERTKEELDQLIRDVYGIANRKTLAPETKTAEAPAP